MFMQKGQRSEEQTNKYIQTHTPTHTGINTHRHIERVTKTNSGPHEPLDPSHAANWTDNEYIFE